MNPEINLETVRCNGNHTLKITIFEDPNLKGLEEDIIKQLKEKMGKEPPFGTVIRCHCSIPYGESGTLYIIDGQLALTQKSSPRWMDDRYRGYGWIPSMVDPRYIKFNFRDEIEKRLPEDLVQLLGMDSWNIIIKKYLYESKLF